MEWRWKRSFLQLLEFEVGQRIEMEMEMEKKLSSAAKALTPSPIQELSHLAQRCNAINLAEGFPDFPAPSHLKDAAVSAILSDFNQYRLVLFSCTQLLLQTCLYLTRVLFVSREFMGEVSIKQNVYNCALW